MRIKAFQGLRPTVETVEQVAAVPYDVVNTEEARNLAANKSLSLLHVSRPEIDLPEGTDPYSDAVYAKAAENFQNLQDQGGLVRETSPCLYVYQQKMGTHSQRGLVAVAHIEDYEHDIIKKHEKTRPDKENDRTRVTGDLNANLGPVFLTYKDSPEILNLVDATTRQSPLFDFTAPDAIQHTVWKIENTEPFVTAFGQIPVAYVADGHHRSASAARVGKERRQANPDHTGDEDYNWFLTVLFPGSELQILAYNRAVHDLNGLDAKAYLDLVGQTFQVEKITSPQPAQPGNVHMYLEKQWYRLGWDTSDILDPVDQLDVSVLQNRLLAPILGIEDPRTSSRIEFIGGIRGTQELEAKVDSGKAAVAFSMYPVSVDQLMAIADANQIMPPKSTWFEPKLRSGLFIHTF